jgi:diguanylate cyclase (GGDEF)-like protein
MGAMTQGDDAPVLFAQLLIRSETDRRRGSRATHVGRHVTDTEDLPLLAHRPARPGDPGRRQGRVPGLRQDLGRSLLPGHSTGPAGLATAWLGLFAWVVIAVGLLAATVVPAGGGRHVAEAVLVPAVGAIGVVLVARLVTASITWPERRTASLVLAASLVLYAVGSSTLASSSEPDLLTFPAPGEGFFLAAYAGMAAFLFLDSDARGRVRLTAALEAAITCGGAACLAGAVLLSPAAGELPGAGGQLLLALLYPLLDVLLTVVVLGEIALRRRVPSWRTASLVAGFSLLAYADSSLLRKLASADGAYNFSAGLTVAWGVALTLIVHGACGPRRESGPPPESRHDAVLPLLAAFAALVVLTLRPTGAEVSSLYLTIPAVLTLAAAGARLGLALREARGAAEAYRLSLTDDLTGLPNRRAVLRRVQSAIDDDEPLALLLLDLDGFKDVNDTLGHAAGDDVLRIVSKRLRQVLPGGVLVARLGGDEFAVAIPDDSEANAMRTARLVGDIVARPTAVLGHTFIMGASVGVTLRCGEASGSDMLRRADIAMYQAKAERAGALMYDPSRDEFTTQRLRTAELLRRGIPERQLRCWYQPQVDADTHEVTGLEALVRWAHPDQGLLPPKQFLQIARSSGLMPTLTEAVAEIVLRDACWWAARGVRPRVSLNIAPPELLNTPLLDLLLKRVDEAGLPANSLVIEVTEDSFIADPERARSALERIRAHDVQVAIDDYGTGFSSLSYLRDLPVQELKLDRSFVRAVQTDSRSRIIIASTNQMARGLGLRTVAEGVEDAEIAARLRSLGIDVLQGFHLAKPMPKDDVEGWLADWAARPHAPVAPPAQAAAGVTPPSRSRRASAAGAWSPGPGP